MVGESDLQTPPFKYQRKWRYREVPAPTAPRIAKATEGVSERVPTMAQMKGVPKEVPAIVPEAARCTESSIPTRKLRMAVPAKRPAESSGPGGDKVKKLKEGNLPTSRLETDEPSDNVNEAKGLISNMKHSEKPTITRRRIKQTVSRLPQHQKCTTSPADNGDPDFAAKLAATEVTKRISEGVSVQRQSLAEIAQGRAVGRCKRRTTVVGMEKTWRAQGYKTSSAKSDIPAPKSPMFRKPCAQAVVDKKKFKADETIPLVILSSPSNPARSISTTPATSLHARGNGGDIPSRDLDNSTSWTTTREMAMHQEKRQEYLQAMMRDGKITSYDLAARDPDGWELEVAINILSNGIGPLSDKSQWENNYPDTGTFQSVNSLTNNLSKEAVSSNEDVLSHTWNEAWTWEEMENQMGMTNWDYKPIDDTYEVGKPVHEYPLTAPLGSETEQEDLESPASSTQASTVTAKSNHAHPELERSSPVISSRPKAKQLTSIDRLSDPKRPTLQLTVDDVNRLYASSHDIDNVYWIGNTGYAYACSTTDMNTCVNMISDPDNVISDDSVLAVSLSRRHSSHVTYQHSQPLSLTPTKTSEAEPKARKVLLKIAAPTSLIKPSLELSVDTNSSTADGWLGNSGKAEMKQINHRFSSTYPSPDVAILADLSDDERPIDEESPYIDFFAAAGFEGYMITRVDNVRTHEGEGFHPYLDSADTIGANRVTSIPRRQHVSDYSERASSEPIHIEQSPRPISSGHFKSLDGLPAAGLATSEDTLLDECSLPLDCLLPYNWIEDPDGVLTNSGQNQQLSRSIEEIVLMSQGSEDPEEGEIVEYPADYAIPKPLTPIEQRHNDFFEDAMKEHQIIIRKRERKRRCVRPEEAFGESLNKPAVRPTVPKALESIATQYADSSDNECEGGFVQTNPIAA